jgi:hypothetical protein
MSRMHINDAIFMGNVSCGEIFPRSQRFYFFLLLLLFALRKLADSVF